MSLPILCFVAAQAMAAQGEPTAWPAEFSASGTIARVSQSSYGGDEANGGAAATWFVRRPLTDDDSPRALQAYLQRLDRLSLSFAGGGLWAGDDMTAYHHSNSSMNGSLGGLFYRGALVLGGGLTYERVDDHQSGGTLGASLDETTQFWSASLSGGLRADTLEVLASYRWRSYYDDGHARPAMWGQALLSLRSVLDNEIELRAEGYTLTDGGGASVDCEFFSRPDLGAWLSGFGERGQIYVNSKTDYGRFGGSLGAGWWATRRLELQLSVGFDSAKQSSGLATAVTRSYASVAIVLRAPERHPKD